MKKNKIEEKYFVNSIYGSFTQDDYLVTWNEYINNKRREKIIKNREKSVDELLNI